MRNRWAIQVEVSLYRWQVYSLFGRYKTGIGSRRGVDYRPAEVRGMEVAIVLPSNLDPLVKELPFKVIACARSSKLFASQASRKSLVALTEYEPTSQESKKPLVSRILDGNEGKPTLTRRCLQELQARSAYSTPAALLSMRGDGFHKARCQMPEVDLFEVGIRWRGRGMDESAEWCQHEAYEIEDISWTFRSRGGT